jgi:hypothetical protein
MNNKASVAVAVLACVLLAGIAFFFTASQQDPAQEPPAVFSGQASDAAPEATQILAKLQDVLAAHRKIVVLFADENTLSNNDRKLANQVGQSLFHENIQRVALVESSLGALINTNGPARFEVIAGLLDYIESGAGLFDADRLAFKEILRSLQQQVAADSALPAIKLHKRVGEDLEALAEIERNYEKEIRLVFGRFDSRAIDLKRERWDDYLVNLKKLYNREQILKEFGVVLPYPTPKDPLASSKDHVQNTPPSLTEARNLRSMPA